MSARGLALWFAGAFSVAMLLAAPLQLAVTQLGLPPGLSAAGVDGSVWRGRLRQARWHGVALGDVRAGLAPLPLLAGRQRIRLRTPQASLSLHAGPVRGMSGASGLLPLPAVSGLGLRASLEDARLLFDAGGCREAGGRVRVDVAVPGDVLPPLRLAGTPACDGAVGRLALLPEDAAGPLWLEATLTVEADGRRSLQALARSDDPVLRAALVAHGFQDAPGGLSRLIEAPGSH
ncbi:type II secretion system protein N [Luteimonas sp. MC1895]|uniref:type II secretion system protein N n=1 Tax=Luteimonas sp. MC1895 TaxID=2819513 RepID=UPI0018F09DB7|nr:type II secretion system protein N [Luteimonas sp. MC1895]